MISSNDDPSIFDLVELYNTKMMLNQISETPEDENLVFASILHAKEINKVPNKVQHLRLFEILATGGIMN